jgi:hypothetical protein
MLTPGSIYTDLGAKQLREMLFSLTQLNSLFGLSNEKFIFEGVHHAQKISILVFEKGGVTDSFEAAFRINPREAVSPSKLEDFLTNRAEHVQVPVSLIRRTAPSSLSVTEFKNDMDVRIGEKMMRFALLGKYIEDSWNLELCNEFHMTGNSGLFKTRESSGRLPLCEGKMIHQFTHQWGRPKYWLNEKEAAGVLFVSRERAVKQTAKKLEIDWNDDEELLLDYKSYRLAFRDVTASTNERTMIMTVLPPNLFCPHTMSLESVYVIRVKDGKLDRNHQLMTNPARLFLCALMNSFVVDAWLRLKVTGHASFFFVYAVPVPRLTDRDPTFVPITERAAKLICTTPQFDDLSREVGLRDHRDGATDPTERARLRAELDGMIAHLYGLTEEEFTHILSTFPLVEQSIKDAALGAYREFAPKPGDQEIATLIAKGESTTLEFKSSARWDIKQNKADKVIEGIVVRTVAALLNSEGGTLLLGVDDDRNVIGLAHDYKLFGKKDSRDAYENFLTGLLLNNLGKDSAALISITFHELDGKDICKVEAKKSPKPVFVKDPSGEHLYVRAGNSTHRPTTKEAIDYCKMHWP